ncbi:MAG: endonuclease III [Desulfonatronovibrionaceae bacterium]
MAGKSKHGKREVEIQEKAYKVLQVLRGRYPEPESALKWNTAWELLVATVLSAQCTDERVNKVLPGLFRRWPGPKDLAEADQQEVEDVVYSTGFYRNKAANLRRAAAIIQDRHSGRVPSGMEELLDLPGVARKTANIVLYGAWGINAGLAVDTHVKRISRRLGLTGHTDPNRVERDLMRLFPRNKWGEINHSLVLFGREVCTAKNPKCTDCELLAVCLWPKQQKETITS